jgi:Cytochrome b5-like Heme/Steroid binding domain
VSVSASFHASTVQYLAIIVAVVVGYSWTASAMFSAEHFKNSSQPIGAENSNGDGAAEDDPDEPDPPRNFTLQQLGHYDGQKDEKSGEDKPVYLSVNGIVFDVTKGKDFYGPGGPYEKVRLFVPLCFPVYACVLLFGE